MPEISPSTYRVDCTWSDVPHLTEQTKAEMLRSYPAHQRDARASGIPKLGIGAIYTVDWDEVVEDPLPRIPDHWTRGYALDPGWNKTACIWGAWDPETDTLHCVGEYYVGHKEPLYHATAIKARGPWMKGVIDPAGRGRTITDGEQIIQTYREYGLKIVPAENAVEAGIHQVQTRLETGRLRFYRSLRWTEWEYGLYRRDEKTRDDGSKVSKIVKVDDHLMDAMRYMVMGFKGYFSRRPSESQDKAAIRIADRKAGY